MYFCTPLWRSIRLTITWLFILLWVYAAVVKLLDFENFQVQLGQSPLVGSYAGILRYAVPFTELSLAFGLSFSPSRRLSLYGSYVMMCLFSVYIYVMLTYSPYVPCSCGGILEQLGWRAHFVFNMLLTALSAIAIVLYPIPLERKLQAVLLKRMCVLLLTALLSGIATYQLYLRSEYMIHQANPFIRRFIPGTCIKDFYIDLPNSDYYFAGSGGGKIYLGNQKAPLHILEIDTVLRQRHEYRIALNDYAYPFRSVQVRPPYFFLMDGTIPIVFKGDTSSWKAIPVNGVDHYFTRAEAVDSIHIVFRGVDKGSGENRLGYFKLTGRHSDTHWGEVKLSRQVDGFFDTDGILLSDVQANRFYYVHYYRNSIISANSVLGYILNGKTIDTISRANLRVAHLQGGLQRKLASPALLVNKHAFANGKLLYVHSGVTGRYESPLMWKTAAIIDVYDVSKGAYLSSGYVYNNGPFQMSDMLVVGYNLYVIMGYRIHRYKLGGNLRPR